MKKLFLLILLNICCSVLYADQESIVLRDPRNQHDHIEYYPPADMPEAYYVFAQEIIIVADGFADYYDVNIVSQSTLLAVISTQIDGYGDSIDISSLPNDNYTIIITSSNNNEFEGEFTNY